MSLGVAMLAKLIRSARAPGGDDPATVRQLEVNGRPVTGPGSGLFLAAFFAVHYGIFTLVHGLIVLHVSVILGVFAISALQWDAAAVLLLIALHAVVDGAGWMLSARRDRRPTGTVAPPPAA